jgi:peptide/nickel transport system permease protein
LKRTVKKPQLVTEPAEALQQSSQKFLRKLLRSFRATWKLYRRSVTGLVGMGIVVGFLVMAIFAPVLSKYSPDFTAPAEDIFIADNAKVDLEAKLNWTSPMGLTDATREQTLKRILVYSTEGTALVFPVTAGASETTGEPGIIVGDRGTIQLPSHIDYIDYAHFYRSIIFILVNSTLYEYRYDLSDYDQSWALPFEPKFISNLWNGYSIVLNQARLAIVFADDHNVTLMDKRPPTLTGGQAETYFSNLTISEKIIANPLVVDGLFANGSMMILPTDAGLIAYNLKVNASLLGEVQDVQIGERRWLRGYEVDGVPFQPVVSNHMITFPYPHIATDEYGKDIIVMASTDGHVIAYDRENGSIKWANKLLMLSIRDYKITDLYPSTVGILVVGEAGPRGFIAGINSVTGLINYNNTQYTSTEGRLDSAPHYVAGQYTYLLSTTAKRIYLLDSLLQINATFGAPGGGAVTPVSYVGNIYAASIIGGNYFSVITEDNHLFVETLSGVNVAPLAPGTYPSGNHYILGTDYEGHDILAQLLYGTRAELMVGITAAFFAVVIGTIVGLVSGFYSGLIDDILMRATDVVLSLPGLVILLLFAAVFGPSLTNIIIIIAILSWAGIARVIRSVTLSLKERAFVDAAIIAGASDSRLILRHIAPNVLPYAFLYMTFTISGAIVTEAILAFLGFGDVNNVTWGMMLQFLQISGHSLDAPWWLLPPGIAITLLSLAFYLIGRAFDEVVNPRLRRR